MPGLLKNSEFKHLQIRELHPTFGAEIDGVDLANASDEEFQEVLAAMAKVRLSFCSRDGLLHRWWS